MKRSVRMTIGVLGLGMLAGLSTGCAKPKVPPELLARIEAAANKAEASANKADAAAKSASESAMRAEAAAAKIASGFSHGMNK